MCLSTPLILYSPIFWLLVAILSIWVGFWKVIGLWFSARNSEKAWFIIFVFINLAGVLELYYLHSRKCWPFKPKQA
ncbi:MAG: DUF5652 family protein [Candidatus Bathyarchaeia archaeon]